MITETNIKWITSKDYRFIRINRYPSKYFLQKFHQNDPKGLKKFHYEINLFKEFLFGFYKRTTGEDPCFFSYIYESIFEELREILGICVFNTEDSYLFCVPKEDNESFNYITDNIKNKYKILKKTRGTYLDRGKSDFYRTEDRRIKENFLKK